MWSVGILQLHKNDKEEEIKHDTLDMPGKKEEWHIYTVYADEIF